MANRLFKAGTAILAASSQQGGTQQNGEEPPAVHVGMCPTTTESLFKYHTKFHSDETCDRVSYDAFKRGLGKHATYQKFLETKEHNLVPNQKTLVCPAVVQPLANPDAPRGYDTNWFVENTASSPIVLAYLNAETGIEYSAFDATVTPPEADPKALLKPGEWRHVNTYEGHVFHAREITDDGSPGRVLLQHRAGLIPVGSRARQWLTCPTDDPEPLVESVAVPGTQVRDPAFARTLERPMKECHLMDLGFRNMAGCPLNVYWQQPDSCTEKFKFHLGTDGYTNDFVWDWDSPTKFESTKIGHTFVFRSPSHPDEVVDTVTVLPTQIVDCPDLKQKTAAVPVRLSGAAEIVVPVTHQDGAAVDATATANATNNTTTTTTTAAGAGAAAAAARSPRDGGQFPDYSSAFFGAGGGSSPF